MEKERRNSDRIDLVDIFRRIRVRWRSLLVISAAAATLGLMFAITTPNLYTAYSTMIPQITERGSADNLSGLASMAGINLGSRTSGYVLSPRLYPRIASNINFRKELIYSPLSISGNREPITLLEYANDKKYRRFSLKATILRYTIGLPGVVLSIFSREREGTQEIDGAESVAGESGVQMAEIEQYDPQERRALALLRSYLSITYNQKDGTLQLTATMTEPLAAAQLAQRGQELLQKYLTEFKVAKAISNLEFIESSYAQARQNFETKQSELARFRDANKSFSSAVARTHEERLLSEYSLLLGVYTELSRQREQAKISVRETTPLLTVIEPVVLPFTKSSPNRLKIIMLFVVAALFAAVLRILIAPFIREYFT